MQDQNQSALLTYSHLDNESISNKNESIKSTSFWQHLQKQQTNCQRPFQGELIVRDQSMSQQQVSYQSLDYGQKIAVSHNILKGLVHMLDQKYPAITSNNQQKNHRKIEKPLNLTNTSHVEGKNQKSNEKLEEKMLEVRDRLSEIITFINKEMDNKPSQTLQNAFSLNQFKSQLQQIQAEATEITTPHQKELIEIIQQSNQSQTIKQVKIVIDRNKLHNAKQVYSQEMLNLHNHEEIVQSKDYMRCSLDKISEAISGGTGQMKSKNVSEINYNVSSVKSEEPNVEGSFNYQDDNFGQLDETGRIILSTINKKTISTTTIPKNPNKVETKKAKEQENPNQTVGKQIRKNKFWKLKTNPSKNEQIKKQSQQQIESKQSLDVQKQTQTKRPIRQIQREVHTITQQNRQRNPLASNSRRVFYRNYSLNDFRRQIPKQTQSMPNSRIKTNFEENPSTASEMKQSAIIRHFPQLHTPSMSQQPQRPQNINPEVIVRPIQPHIIINQPSPNYKQQRQPSRLNLMPQPSNRPHSLPNHINRNNIQNSLPIRTSLPANIPHLLSPQNMVTVSPRPINLNNYSIIGRNSTIFTGQKHADIPKSPKINRKIVFPQRSHLMPVKQTQPNFVPQPIFNVQQQPTIVKQQTVSLTNAQHQHPLLQKKPQSTQKFRPTSANELQKIIELSEQSIQNSVKRDNRSEVSLQTSAYNLHQSNVSHSTSILNARPLKKRGIQITSKQLTNVDLMQ